MPIRTLIVEDQKMILDGLRALLAESQETEVIGQAGDGREAVTLCRTLRPNIVLMDVQLPGLNGFDATIQILEDSPDVGVVALSLYSKGDYVTRMLSAGARGYVLKASAFEELTEAIRAVHEGRTYLSTGLPGTFADYLPELPEGVPDPDLLSPREREVLQLVAEGHLTKEIASYLGISFKTVDSHRQRIVKKLGVHGIAELTRYALRNGLTSLEN